jgi:ketosteroid isomerase-like protein
MSTSATTQGIAAIQALREQWAPHFNAGKISELGELFYASDAYALPGGSDLVKGRAEITRFLRDVRDSGDVRFELDVIDTYAEGDLGYLVGNYVFTDASGVAHQGLTHEAYRRGPDGSWQCVVDMWHHIDS